MITVPLGGHCFLGCGAHGSLVCGAHVSRHLTGVADRAASPAGPSGAGTASAAAAEKILLQEQGSLKETQAMDTTKRAPSTTPPF